MSSEHEKLFGSKNMKESRGIINHGFDKKLRFEFQLKTEENRYDECYVTIALENPMQSSNPTQQDISRLETHFFNLIKCADSEFMIETLKVKVIDVEQEE